MRNSRSSVILGCLIVAALSGCSTQPVHLDSQFSTERLRSDVGVTNSFRLLSIQDVRRDKKSLGRIACRNVKNEHVLAWLTQGLQAIGISADKMAQIDQNVIGVDVSLIMLHARSVEVAMSCNVVLKVRFSKDGTELKEAIYRGHYTSLNWVSGEGEIGACFDRALTKALESMQADMITIEQMRAVN